MEHARFIIIGEDKKTLSNIKNVLTANGYTYIGYTKEANSVLRHLKSHVPDLVIIEVQNRFRELRKALEVIDDELLASCILILENRNSEVIDFLRNSRILSYLTKPVYNEALLQVIDLSLINYRRVQNYEAKVKKLNSTLESRRIIEKAKWILVEQEGLTEAEAYEVIQKKSRDNRMPMIDIAEAIMLTRG